MYMNEPIPERIRYYNPALDTTLSPAEHDALMQGAADDYNGGPLMDPTDEHPANLVSSLCVDGRHRPALDIDIPMQVIPSSTDGHAHLYFPTLSLDDGQYDRLLDALAEAGIIDQGYRDASASRGQTLLRLPHVRKARRCEPVTYSHYVLSDGTILEHEAVF